jgi:2',3'-cyclic-nucleotide 2'-phosphodiesterase (5'-nucleotidase family)
VKSVSVNGKPLDPMATYTVATNDFIADGGDGYAVLTETKSLIDGDAAQYMASMVMDFVAAAGEVAPKIEGRVKAVD